MEKEKFLLETSVAMFMKVLEELELEEELEDVAKRCANCAKIIWDKACPLH